MSVSEKVLRIRLRVAKLDILKEIYSALAEQAEPAYDEENACCVYRDDKGRKCAIGSLILDTEYDSSVEDMSFAQVMRSGVFAPVLDRLDARYGELPRFELLEFLHQIQSMHDSSTNEFRRWIGKMSVEERQRLFLSTFVGKIAESRLVCTQDIRAFREHVAKINTGDTQNENNY